MSHYSRPFTPQRYTDRRLPYPSQAQKQLLHKRRLLVLVGVSHDASGQVTTQKIAGTNAGHPPGQTLLQFPSPGQFIDDWSRSSTPWPGTGTTIPSLLRLPNHISNLSPGLYDTTETIQRIGYD